MNKPLTIALIRRVFPGSQDGPGLAECLRRARDGGAVLALLPELPLNDWSPISRTARPEDAEPPEGPRHQRLAEAAAGAGIGVVGGAIVTGPDGRRRNTALVFDGSGRLVTAYAKVHLPEEPGYWETSHYDPGDGAPTPFTVPPTDMAMGLQICSDINRPAGGQLLADQGAQAILVPRATEPGSWPRWQLVMRAVALTTAAYVVSVNRPDDPEVPIGGPSVVMDPDGNVVLETTEEMVIAHLAHEPVVRARTSYPGYLPPRPRPYLRGWSVLDGPQD